MPPSRWQLPTVADRWGMRGASVCGSSVHKRIELMPLSGSPPFWWIPTRGDGQGKQGESERQILQDTAGPG
eukprot:1378178-Pyramimonas_sp.AAC.1